MTYGLPHQQGQSAQSGQPPPYGQGQFPQAQGPMYGRRMGGMRGMGGPQSGSASFGQRNQASLTAIVVSIIYVVLAVTAHFVLLGIFPALMCVRAFQRKELLAPLAAVAAGVAIVAAVLAYAH
jgi:hypothetical protein